jgi:hypothetical protein
MGNDYACGNSSAIGAVTSEERMCKKCMTSLAKRIRAEFVREVKRHVHSADVESWGDRFMEHLGLEEAR